MKGRFTFTNSEAEEIIMLIKQKLEASPQEQKSIRNKIRKKGFYASDFGLKGGQRGYDVNDFLNAITIVP